MSNIDRQYLQLLNKILEEGNKKDDRTGTGNISIFGEQLKFNLKDGFPLLTTKKMAWKVIVSELLFFLRGETNINFLLERKSHIWDGDAYRKFVESSTDEEKEMIKTKEGFINQIKIDENFKNKWGDLGPVYGYQWRKWGKHTDESKVVEIDQFKDVIHKLKTDPDNRRLIVSAWNVSDMDKMTLPPCHMLFQFYTDELSYNDRLGYVLDNFDWGGRMNSMVEEERMQYMDEMGIPRRNISLQWYQRSNDVPLGTPFNCASYALLLHIVGKLVNMIPYYVVGALGDCHIYNNQIDGVNEQLKRQPLDLPKLRFSDNCDFSGDIDDLLKSCDVDDFIIDDYKSHPRIYYPLSN